MKIGFIGCGNMARPIIKGILKNAKETFDTVCVYDILREPLLAFCAETGAVAAKDSLSLVAASDVVVLATKPQTFPELLPQIANGLKRKNPLVASIAAGKTLSYIGSFLGYDARLGRIFPNLNAEVGQSVSSYCVNENANEGDAEILRVICESYGMAVALPEELFSAFGVLSGCAPAYTFMYIGALASAAVENGLSAELALPVACQMALGSAQTLLKTGEQPDALIKRVCSPGGTTIEGVNYLRENGFEKTVRNAYQASFDKDKKL
ncbi:MAG: pyrroline-5-carboxylate reductase [Oscillospiraceae bacterium]|jgi:pyrroline-5-carboxylate reductase|nr:pyrroline-5-carboxylate reductase [Oscillospiraceae bacterium]